MAEAALPDLYRVAACPQVSNNGVLELIVVEHARQSVLAFVDRHRDRLERLGRGLAGLFDDWLTTAPTFDEVWDPAFGGIRAALLSDDDCIGGRGAALALRLHECGHAGEWTTRLSRPTRLRFGRWIIAAEGTIHVSTVGGRMTVHVRRGRSSSRIRFSRQRARWDADPQQGSLQAVKGTRWTVWPPASMSSWEFDGLRQSLTTDDPAPLLEACGLAWKLLTQRGGVYGPWVGQVIRHLVAWEAVPGQLPSGSSSASCAPGVIGIGNHRHVVSLADTLVHEATHQYFYIITRLGPVDDGTDSNAYYNPFLETNRPIDRILLAYHAFGNIVLFCQILRRNGLPADEYVVSRQEYLQMRLPSLEEPLRATRALTPLGRSLFETLHHEIHRERPSRAARALRGGAATGRREAAAAKLSR